MSEGFDVTAATFEVEVLAASQSEFVLVDFWAPWCNPCRTLKPLLERLSGEYGYRLAKVNTEQEPELATAHGVRGIPDVRLYHQGDVVDRFSGALPEGEVRAFLGRYFRSQVEQALAAIEGLEQQGTVAEVEAAYTDLLQNYPERSEIRLHAARFLYTQAASAAAEAVLQPIRLGDPHYDSAQRLRLFGDLSRACRERAAVDGVAALYAEAACATLEGRYDEALEQFLQVVMRDRTFGEGAGRKGLLLLFDQLGSGDPRVKSYQRRLAMLMH